MGQKRILIIRQDRLGDVVLATALPREIKRQWPEAFVAVMVRSYARDIFLHNPHVDLILTDDYDPDDKAAKRRSFWAQVRALRKLRFSHALMLLPKARYNYMTFCAGIPVRVGVGAVLFHLITLARFVMRHKYRVNRHEADFSLDLARKIGLRSDDDRPEIHLAPAEQSKVAERRLRWQGGDAGGRGGRPRRLVGIHVTSGQSAPNWRPAIYRRLIDQLSADPRYQILVTDNRVPEEVDAIPGVIYPNRDGALRDSLLNFAALDCLVSASTGPMHICAALGVATVALFCPEPTCAPVRWGPLGNRSELVLPPPDFCQTRCPGDPHLCTFEDEQGMAVSRVAAAVSDLLAPTVS